MKQEELLYIRQRAGYSIHMLAELLHITVEEYLAIEFSLRSATDRELEILTTLLYKD